MGKIVQVKTGYSAVGLPPNGLAFNAGQTTTLTDAEYAALTTATTRALTITQSGVADPVRTPPVNPTSLSDAVAQAESYAASYTTANAASVAEYLAREPVAPATHRVAQKIVRTVREWQNWLGSAKGSVTEFGFPCQATNATSPGSDYAHWAPVAETFFSLFDETDVVVSQWLDDSTTSPFGALNGWLSTSPSIGVGVAPLINHRRRITAACLQGNWGLPGASPVGSWPGFYAGASDGTLTPAASQQQFYNLCAKLGIGVVRCSVTWEFLQRTLNGPLSTVALAWVDAQIAKATAAGLKVILDIHNYAGYQQTQGQARLRLGDGTLTQAHLVDLWTKLSTYYQGNPGIYAYELMNEPMGMSGGTFQTTTTNTGSNQGTGASIAVASTAAFPGSGTFGVLVGTTPLSVHVSGSNLIIDNSTTSATWSSGATVSSPQLDWQGISQAVLSAIRANGDNTQILVPGYDYSSMARWVVNHPTPWITDSANNFRYNAHYYWSASGNGDAAYDLPWSTEMSAVVFASNSGGYLDLDGDMSVGGRMVAAANRLKPLTGITNLDRLSSRDTCPALTQGTCYWAILVAEADETFSNVTIDVAVTGSNDGTVQKVALWKVDSTKGVIRQATSNHRSTMFSATGLSTTGLTSSVTLKKGLIYAVSILQVGAVTGAQLRGVNGFSDSASYPFLTMTKTGYSDMPGGTVPGGFLSSNTWVPYVKLT